MEQQKIKVGFVSLGCPKNLIDTETMLYALNEEGFEIVADETLADVVIINTCAFIESSKQEAIDNILDIAWLKEHKDLKGIVVTGCLAERYKERVRKEMPEADAVLGIGAENELAEAVRKVYNGENYESYGDINAVPLSEPRVVTTGDYFAYIKIAEGCDNCCSYCVIPYIRGRFRSRQMSDIIEEAKSLADMGIKEVCLVAQDTTRYGEDIYGTPSLDSLIHEISEIDGIEWIRVLYCYPDRITDGLIEEIRTNDKVCKYIYMPIQHINDDILKRMNRRDTRESIEAVIKKLRERIPGIYLRTTVITGFPGETEKQFNELLQFVKETKFERLGAFEYSREEGTVAFDMPD
ncbi:MAG: 30S ribosomal protein S12 methylthiotransferase RimO, partial [Clostridia bacterium]|nr:30S ribosomal protein S12 methylthiotransferase RimO [Clostridia bacterium]